MAPAPTHGEVMDPDALEFRAIEVVRRLDTGCLAGRNIRVVKNAPRWRAFNC